MRNGFTKIPNRFWGMARELEIKANEGFCLLWLLSHSQRFKNDLSIWKMREELGLERKIANSIIERLIEKLSNRIAVGLWEDLLPPIPEVLELLQNLLEKRGQNTPLGLKTTPKNEGGEKTPMKGVKRPLTRGLKDPYEGGEKTPQEDYKKIKEKTKEKTNAIFPVSNEISFHLQEQKRNVLKNWFLDQNGLIKHQKIQGDKRLLGLFFEDYLSFLMINDLKPNFFQLSQRISRDTGRIREAYFRENGRGKPASFKLQAQAEENHQRDTFFGLLKAQKGA